MCVGRSFAYLGLTITLRRALVAFPTASSRRGATAAIAIIKQTNGGLTRVGPANVGSLALDFTLATLKPVMITAGAATRALIAIVISALTASGRR
jgi:hypothetical protein